MSDTLSTRHGLNSTANITEDYNVEFKFEMKAVLALYVPLLIASLTGNFLVCVTVLRNREMRSRRWYFFLVNLAVADMGIAFVSSMFAMQASSINLG